MRRAAHDGHVFAPGESGAPSILAGYIPHAEVELWILPLFKRGYIDVAG